MTAYDNQGNIVYPMQPIPCCDESASEPIVATSCECPVSSFCQVAKSLWCKRHNVSKSETWYGFCRTRPDYFELWETGTRGPGQTSIPIDRSSQGLGDTIEKVIKRVFGKRIKGGCGCRWRKRWLNTLVPYR